MQELDVVALREDLPAYGLKKDDVGTVVLVHGACEGYEVEFVSLSGNTIAVATVAAEQVRPVASREIAHARMLAS